VIIARSPDTVLLERVARGDRDALGALYELLGPAVHGVARRVTRAPALAEEITHDVFLAVWQKAPTFDPALGSARTWILTIAHRRAVDVVRREQSMRDRGTLWGARGGGTPFDEVADTVLARAATRLAHTQVTGALGVLTPLQRQSITLAYFEGLTYRQVAEELQIPLATAKTRIRDGLRRMAREFSVPGSTDALNVTE
jgi:RNA polymerase sigma-70 factor (ECF subfamily)